jgi:hypothetical protein
MNSKVCPRHCGSWLSSPKYLSVVADTSALLASSPLVIPSSLMRALMAAIVVKGRVIMRPLRGMRYGYPCQMTWWGLDSMCRA